MVNIKRKGKKKLNSISGKDRVYPHLLHSASQSKLPEGRVPIIPEEVYFKLRYLLFSQIGHFPTLLDHTMATLLLVNILEINKFLFQERVFCKKITFEYLLN